jgi:phosphohistidine swiveling domain-containing protein
LNVIDIRRRPHLTKADVLLWLSQKLRHCVIDPFSVYTVQQWRTARDSILNSAVSRFSSSSVIVRSSALDEDQIDGSTAGRFKSQVVALASDRDQTANAIECVIDSYSRDRRSVRPDDQFFIQSYLKDPIMAGVVLTRDPPRFGPYYVINYDDQTRTTDSVTKGVFSQLVKIARWINAAKLSARWSGLITAIKELEVWFEESYLDIEFGIDHNGVFHLFQVRPLRIGNEEFLQHDAEVAELNENIRAQLKVSIVSPPLFAGPTVLADMSDWNPAEMLGERCAPLDFSLYRFLITERTWREARVSLGYLDVAPLELMKTVANKPYIDVRVSCASLTPASIDLALITKLLNHYIDRIKTGPEIQDKIEFELVFSCFDLTYAQRSKVLLEAGFTRDDVASLRSSLLEFTNSLFRRAFSVAAEDLLQVRRVREPLRLMHDIESVRNEAPATLLERVSSLLGSCRQWGVFPFCRLARVAFVTIALWRSLVRAGVLSDEAVESILTGIRTVATAMDADYRSLRAGKLSADIFFARYGHLRPGAYSILAQRLDLCREVLCTEPSCVPRDDSGLPVRDFMPDERLVSRALSEEGLRISGTELFRLTFAVVRGRERSKFEFTKLLSLAIEYLALAGERMGMDRAEVALLNLDDLFSLSRSSNLSADASRLKRLVDSRRRDQTLSRLLALPPTLRSPSDLVCVQYYAARPNFVTLNRAEADISVLEPGRIASAAVVRGRIVLLESADPGYDWLFGSGIAGLITKHGGVASHMAIRCGEFSVPGAIGVGEVLYEQLRRSKRVCMDCNERRLFMI